MKTPGLLRRMSRPLPGAGRALLVLLAGGLLTGCAGASLRAARSAIAAGDYPTAHQELVAARNDPRLSDRQRREVADDLCLTEYKVGAPAYPTAEQLSICREAANAGAGQSATLLATIAASQRTAETNNINQAIAHADLAGAEAAIARYRALPGADPRAVTQWSKQLWEIVGRDDAHAAKSRHRALQPAISLAAREFPQVHAMNDLAFARWVERNMRVDGTSLVSSVKVAEHTLTLRIPDDQLAAAATNLYRFAKVNDAMVARCGCDGRTNVASQDGELPAYLVRLDPATRRSEILVLAQH
jgi:hypothetical protein